MSKFTVDIRDSTGRSTKAEVVLAHKWERAQLLMIAAALSIEKTVKEIGPCDHGAGICFCYEVELARNLREITESY